MKKYTPYLLTAVIAGILVAAYFPLRNYYLFLKEPVFPLTNAIPPKTALILKTGSAEKLIRIIRASDLSAMLRNNSSGYGFQQLAETVDEISKKSEFFGDMARECETMLCLVPGNNRQPEPLYLLSTGKAGPESIRERLLEVLPENAAIKKIKSDRINLYRVSSGKKEMWFYVRNGIMAISGSRWVAEQSGAMTAGDQSLSGDAVFARIARSSGKRVDGALLLNNARLVELFLQTNDYNPLVFNESPFDGWTSVDLHIGKDKVLMDGFMACKNDSTLLTGQKPGKPVHIRYFPANAAFALTMTLSDQEKYMSGINARDTFHLPGYDSANRISSNEIFRRSEHLRSWIGNTVSLIAMPGFFAGNDSARMVMIGLKDPDSAFLHLKPFLRPNEKGIFIFTASRLTGQLWGKLFSIPATQYCLITDQVLVLSPSKSLLTDYSADLADGRLMGSTGLYAEISSLIAEESNIAILLNPSVSSRFARKFNPAFRTSASNQWFGVPASSGLICLQLSPAEQMLYTHAFALLDPGVLKLAQLQVKTDEEYPRIPPRFASGSVTGETDDKAINADGGIDGISRLIVPSGDNGDNSRFFAIRKSQIHCLSSDGIKLWSFSCKGEPSGEITGIRLKGSVHYLAATSTHLHIIGNDGRETKPPIKIPSGTKGKISVFDYDRNGNYRILYQGNDGKIHNMTLEGTEVAEWQKPGIGGSLKTLQFFRTLNRDFILISEKKGKTGIVDRRGKTRIKVKEGFSLSSGSDVFLNKTNNKGIFLMASAEGLLTYLDANGNTSDSRFGDHGRNPWFDYADFDKDGNNDFVFGGKGKITIYSRMKKIIAETAVKNADFSRPVLYLSDKGNWLAVRERSTGKITAFNHKNKVYSNARLFSECDPVLVRKKGENNPVLVTVSKGKPVLTLLK